MTSSRRHANRSTDVSSELRQAAKGTRRRLGRVVESASDQAELRARAKATGAALGSQVKDAASGAQETARHTVAQAVHVVHGVTSQPALDKSAAVASGLGDRSTALAARARAATPEQVGAAADQAGAVARRHPAAVIAAALCIAAVLAALVRRGRR
ncbi:hypothetical protein GXW83_14065 [Streptacidiphilus sp. PB12-B1b]|uniref:hypothetical protein n=1 Tax=Streptacidiphilus sp. PB12-B1b TaxID=2705012 RepID=UPI0015FD422E|nr:hypothetical protein [Streptacidiphilus sp. PB12-B1b]QMU76700.1 hypothetical protein GXW83_14065 [Streptacidiphilus sp. PB12-B1b]